MMAEVVTVYSYYDCLGALLYVGVTSRAFVRSHEHASSKEWWLSAAGCYLEHFPTREAALERERELIERHRPPFNKQHNAAPLAYTHLRKTIDDLPPLVGARLLVINGWGQMSLAQRRRAFYSTPREMRVLFPCVSCGQRPAQRGGPTCEPCWAEIQSSKRQKPYAGTTAGPMPTATSTSRASDGSHLSQEVRSHG